MPFIGQRGEAVYPGTMQVGFQLLGDPITSTAGHSANASFGHLVAMPASTSLRYVTPLLPPGNTAGFKFALAHDSVSAKTATAKIWGVTELRGDRDSGPEYSGELALELALTAGAQLLDSTSKLFVPPVSSNQMAWVSTISKTTDKTRNPGAQVLRDITDGVATIEFDAEYWWGFIVELRCGSASMGAWALYNRM